MKKSPNQLPKIIEYNKRSPLVGPNYKQLYNQFLTHHKVISAAVLDDINAEKATTKVLSRFWYVLCISLLQDCAKKWIKTLIDGDFEYVNRLNTKYKMEFDINHIGHFIQKKITIGDFIAHNFLPNSLEELSKLYSVLLEKDIYASMRKVFADFTVDKKEDEDFGDFVEAIKKCFLNRHIVAHELSDLEEGHQTEIYKMAMGIILIINSLHTPIPAVKNENRSKKKNH